MVTRSLKINWVSVTYNSGFTESQFYVFFSMQGKKKKGVVTTASTFEGLFDDFV